MGIIIPLDTSVCDRIIETDDLDASSQCKINVSMACQPLGRHSTPISYQMYATSPTSVEALCGTKVDQTPEH